jgi:hypothetical protein
MDLMLVEVLVGVQKRTNFFGKVAGPARASKYGQLLNLMTTLHV